MTETMAAVVQFALEPGAVELREMPRPDPGPGEVLLRVRGVGVCGSDVHQFHNTQSWSVRVPVILGHEFCGTVAALGPGVKGFAEGDLVASETAADIDANSPLTRIGQYNLDPGRRGFGYDIHGAMAEYVAPAGELARPGPGAELVGRGVQPQRRLPTRLVQEAGVGVHVRVVEAGVGERHEGDEARGERNPPGVLLDAQDEGEDHRGERGGQSGVREGHESPQPVQPDGGGSDHGEDEGREAAGAEGHDQAQEGETRQHAGRGPKS